MSSWSEIRSRATDDPLLDTIADLQARANQSEAIDNIVSTDKIPPIRIIRSRVEISDNKMLTGYTRPRTVNQTYFMPLEPDANHLRIDIKFDSGCDILPDYSLQGNEVNIGYTTNGLPTIIKGTEDDTITAGDLVSVLDGKTHHYRIPVNSKNSIKQMVLNGKPGLTIIYRHFPLSIQSEINSGNTQRATIIWFIENDQVEYAIKAQVDDAGYIYFFFRYQFINYFVRTTSPVIIPPSLSDYFGPDYNPADYDSLLEEFYTVTFPIPYIDLAFSFNFATKEIVVFVNGAQVPVVTGTSVVLVPPLPTPIFPPAFSDPPPPPPTPQPFLQPFSLVYSQPNETGVTKINAITATQQDAFYNIPGGVPSTMPLELVYDIPVGIDTVVPPPTHTCPAGQHWDEATQACVADSGGGGGTPPPVVDWSDESNYNLLGGIDTTDSSSVVLSDNDNDAVGLQINDGSTGLGQKLVGKVINLFAYYARGESTPTGPIRAKIWDQNGNEVWDFGSAFDSSTMETDSTYHRHRFMSPNNTTVMQEGYKVGIEYIAGGGSDTIKLQRTSADQDASVSQASRDAGGSASDWQPNTDHDPRMYFMMRKTGVINAATGSGGGTDQWGVRAAYGTGEIIYNPTEDFKDGSYRWDFESLGSSRFVSCEHIAYIATSNPPSDEVSGIVGGGKHGTTPKCYVIGIDTISGATRYRKEEIHPEYEDGEDGASGVGLSTNYVGYKYVKWNKSNGVQLEIWQDTGNNNGTAPANQWTLVSSWLETDKNWQTPPSDHQETLRIDGNNDELADLQVKWQSLREIKTTDTGEGGPPPPPPPTHTCPAGQHWDDTQQKCVADTVAPPVVTGPSAQQLANRTGMRTFVGEYFGNGFPISGTIITTIQLMIWRTPEATAGTILLTHYDAQSAIKRIYTQQSIVSLPISKPNLFNFVWQDINNTKILEDGDRLGVEVIDCPNGIVYVMSNSGNAGPPPPPTTQPLPGLIIPSQPTVQGMIYQGGPTYSAPNIYIIFDGTAWNTLSTPFTKQQFTTACDTVFSSTYFDALLQYSVKKPKSHTYVVNTTLPLPTTYTLTDVQATIENSKSTNLVPSHLPTSNHNIYIIMAAPGKTFTPPVGVANPNQPAFNTTYATDANNRDATSTVYTIHTFKTGYTLATFTYNTFAQIVDLMTAPININTTTVAPNAWKVNPAVLTTANGVQICDPAENTTPPIINGVTVAAYFSNIDAKSVPPPATTPTWITCSTGSTYDPVTQTCVSTGTGGGGGGGTGGTQVVNRTWHGAMCDPDCNEDGSGTLVTAFNALSVKPIAVCYFTHNWYGGNMTFPATKANSIKAAGAVPLIRWQIWESEGNTLADLGTHTHANITAGMFDTQLIAYAQAVKTFGTVIMIQYCVEVNGNWFPWHIEGPTAYKNAYKHIIDLFRAQGVTNVKWAFQVDATEDNTGSQWYPGDSYIDWVGTSCYGVYQNGQNGCISELEKCWTAFSSISQTKPLGIFEWGQADVNDTTTTLTTIATDPKYVRIKLLMVWHEKLCDPSDPIPPEGRINATTQHLTAYRNGIANAHYLGTGFDGTGIATEIINAATGVNPNGLAGNVIFDNGTQMTVTAWNNLPNSQKDPLISTIKFIPFGTVIWEDGSITAVSGSSPKPPFDYHGTNSPEAATTGGATPIISPTSVHIMKDFGGIVLRQNVVVHFIFWGSDWNTRSTPWSKSNMDAFLQTLFQSRFFDTLFEYRIKRPVMGKSVIQSSFPIQDNYGIDDIIQLITVSISSGLVPDKNTGGKKNIYMIFPERGSQGDSDAEPSDAGGYHDNYFPSNNINDPWVYSMNFYSDSFIFVCSVISHEICEAITDPQPMIGRLGIYGDDVHAYDATYGQEISDLCEFDYSQKIGPYTVNPYISNHAGGCVVPHSAISFASCPTGYKWNDVTQSCDLIPTPPPPSPGGGGGGGTTPPTGNPANDFDTTRSFIVCKNFGSTNFVTIDNKLDISGKFSIGGSSFIGYFELNDIRKRTGLKANKPDSIVIGKVITKVDTVIKKAGAPLNGPITCCIRNSVGAIKATIGVWDSANLLDGVATPVQFINTHNTVALELSDTLSIEYYQGTSTDFIMVRTNDGFFNSADADNTMLFESLTNNLNTTTTIFRRDFAAILYTGGVIDELARPMKGVRVNNTQSVLFDKIITEARLKLKASGILGLGNILRVKIIRGSDKSTQIILGQLDITSISTTEFIEYYFQNPGNTYRMKVGDMVALEFNHGNSVQNFLEVRTSTGDTYDGQNTIMFEYNGTAYSNITDRDLSGTMSIGGFTVYPEASAPVVIPPFHYAHEWILDASGPDDSNALDDPAILPMKSNSFYNNISKEFRIYDMLLTPQQLQYYYENRFTITPIPKGKIEIVGHDFSPLSP